MKKVLCIEPYGPCKVGNWYKLDYETTSEWTIILPPDSISIYTSMKVPRHCFKSESEIRDSKIGGILSD